jgi:hypothetical protein
MLKDKGCENEEMKKCAEEGQGYRVHFKWTTWEAGLRWVNCLEMSMVIMIMACPIRV